MTSGEKSAIKPAEQVYVAFADGNRVPAKIRGFDPDADVALVKIDPAGLKLTPLPLGDSDAVKVGTPVAAMGSPFGEEQSLSVGVVSAIDRSIDSLTDFAIPDAIQTDAAINPGNSGGPLVDAQGRVIGLNQQIKSSSGGGEGVGFAVPINLAKRSLGQLRSGGKVEYAYIGIASQPVYPQLAKRFGLPVQRGVWVQEATAGGPAAKAGVRGGSGKTQFQADTFATGGDVIVSVDGKPVSDPSDLADAIVRHEPGDKVPVVVYRGKTKRTVTVTLGRRPDQVASGR